MMSISTTLFGEILHANLFFTGQLRNRWQMLAEPWGFAEPRLKITAPPYTDTCSVSFRAPIFASNQRLRPNDQSHQTLEL